jgi:hypothetical protein
MSAENQEFELLYKGRLNGDQKKRLKNLFDMMYSPREIADEIGFNKGQIYNVYLKEGCPHERDDRRQIWINGLAFRE